MDLSKAQLRVLRLAQSDPEHRYNGRIRWTAEILKQRGLITYDWWPRKHGAGDITEVWQVAITDAGRDWLAINGGE